MMMVTRLFALMVLVFALPVMASAETVPGPAADHSVTVTAPTAADDGTAMPVHADTAADHTATGDHGSGHGTEAKSEGLPQFNPTWFASQVFWLVIAFAIILFVFSKSLLPRISGTLQHRRDHIDGDMRLAETFAAEAEKIKSGYEDTLRRANEEASRIIREVEESAVARANKNQADFRVKYDSLVQQAEADIAVAKESAMLDMNRIAAEIAADAAQKIVGISTDVHQAANVVASLQKNVKAA